MGKLIRIVFFVCVVGILGSCSVNDEIPLSAACGNLVTEDQSFYDAISTNNYTITGVSIDRNCLTISISSSGCSGNSWAGTLVAAEDQQPSIPPKRELRLSLINNEACLAVFQRSFTFNLNNIRPDDSEILVLDLEGWDQQIILN